VFRSDVFHPTQLVCLYSNWTDGSQVKLVLKAARQVVGVSLGKMPACWPLNRVVRADADIEKHGKSQSKECRSSMRLKQCDL